VENLKRVVVGREAVGDPTVRQGPGAPGASSLREGAQEAQEGRAREAGSRTEGDVLWRGTKSPGEYRPAPAPAGGRVRILAGSKTLKPRGIVTFWSSEQQDAMS
jgi:hypothetical protein